MPWQLAMILFLLFASAHLLYQRVLSTTLPDTPKVNFTISYILGLLPLGFTYAGLHRIITGDTIDLSFSAEIWFRLIVGGAIFAISFIALFKCNRNVNAAEYSLASNMVIIATVFMGITFFNDTLTAKQWMGFLLILVSVVGLSGANIDRSSLKLDKYFVLTLLFNILLAIAITNESYILDEIGFVPYLIVGWPLQMFWMAIATNKDFKNIDALKKDKNILKLAALGFVMGLSGLTILYSFSVAELSEVSTFIAFRPALVVVGAFFLLKEKDHVGIKAITTAIATAGLILVST